MSESRDKSDNSVFCTFCGKRIAKDEVICIFCDLYSTAHKNFCRTCGCRLNSHQVICLQCGMAVETNPTNGTENSNAGFADTVTRRVIVSVIAFVVPLISVNIVQKLMFFSSNSQIDRSILDIAWKGHNYFNVSALAISLFVAIVAFFLCLSFLPVYTREK